MNTRILTEAQEAQIVALYLSGKMMTGIAKQFSVCRQLISKTLARHGIQGRSYLERFSRKYTINESAFDNADTEEAAAYFVGLLMADGCIRQRPHTTEIQLSLAGEDGKMVSTFRDFVGSNKPLRLIRSSSRNFRGNATFISQQQTEIRIFSAKIGMTLAKYGVSQKKTAREHVHLLERNRNFWRGLVDGDGAVTLRPPRKKSRVGYMPTVSLVGSRKIIEQFLSFCSTITNHHASPRRSTGCWRTSICGIHAVAVLRALYENATVSIERKLKVALDILSMEWTPKLKSWMNLTSDGLLDLRIKHGSWKKVSDFLGMNPDVLRYTRRRLGIYQSESGKTRTSSPLGKFTCQMLTDAYKKHGTWRDVARHIGMNPNSIYYLRDKLGVNHFHR